MDGFVKVAAVADIPAGTARCVEVNGKRVAVFHVAGEFYAIDDRCSHAEASLSEGTIDGDRVECPRHGAWFNIKTGAALSLPALMPVATYRVKVVDEEVYVSVDA